MVLCCDQDFIASLARLGLFPVYNISRYTRFTGSKRSMWPSTLENYQKSLACRPLMRTCVVPVPNEPLVEVGQAGWRKPSDWSIGGLATKRHFTGVVSLRRITMSLRRSRTSCGRCISKVLINSNIYSPSIIRFKWKHYSWKNV